MSLKKKQMPCTVVIPKSLTMPEARLEGRLAGIAKVWSEDGDQPRIIVELSKGQFSKDGSIFISHIVVDVGSVEPRTESGDWDGDLGDILGNIASPETDLT
jgi:hypothetical protein